MNRARGLPHGPSAVFLCYCEAHPNGLVVVRQEAHVIRFRDALIGCGVYVLLDVSVAQVFKHTDAWGPMRNERLYRDSSAIYHHGLAKNVNLTARSGGLSYPIVTNSLGFRDSRIRTISVRSTTPRVLFIGDSFTEGIGVSYSDTYVGVLDRSFRAKGIELLNAAVISYAPTIYYRKIKYLLEDVGLWFDYLVVAIDLSDITDEAQTYRLDGAGNVVYRSGYIENNRKSVLKDNSLFFHVADVVKDLLRDRVFTKGGDLGLSNDRSDWTIDRSAYEEYGREGLRLAGGRMEQVLALTRSRGMGMAIIVYPWPTQIFYGDRASVHVRFWQSWAHSHDVPLFNLFPSFFSSADSIRTIQENYIPYDVHWSERGHRLVAETLMMQGLTDTVIGHVSRAAHPSHSVR